MAIMAGGLVAGMEYGAVALPAGVAVAIFVWRASRDY